MTVYVLVKISTNDITNPTTEVSVYTNAAGAEKAGKAWFKAWLEIHETEPTEDMTSYGSANTEYDDGCEWFVCAEEIQ